MSDDDIDKEFNERTAGHLYKPQKYTSESK
jgi:hypothetical protein